MVSSCRTHLVLASLAFGSSRDSRLGFRSFCKTEHEKYLLCFVEWSRGAFPVILKNTIHEKYSQQESSIKN
jgi:hypothetical protein